MFNIGIIGGAGRMGSWFSQLFLSHGFNVGIYDIDKCRIKELSEKASIKIHESLGSLVKENDIIMIAAPLKVTPCIIERIRSTLTYNNKVNKIVFDIATFKSNFIHLYEHYPQTVKVSSVHPLFGPGAKTPGKYTVVIVPVPSRESDSEITEDLFRKLGFKIKRMDYKLHDKIVALTIGISHVVGLSLAFLTSSYEISYIEELSGTTFKYLTIHFKSAIQESEDFFEYILSENNIRVYVKELINILNTMIEKPQEILKNINKVRECWNADKTKEAYTKMYQCLETIILQENDCP